MNAIECQGLSKAYKRGVYALNHLSLKVEPQQVYGFLGQNGAGKTTTIRLLLDLIRPTDGQVLIFGESVRRRSSVLRQVGALVEGASFYPYLSAWDNLEVLGRTFGNFDPKRADMLLETLGLKTHQSERVGKYSTGMKQRLGIVAALLHDPKIVILDEPTNGLDPKGIHALRAFLRMLVEEQGKTVFLSSHLFGEVQQTCDRVAIINQGQLIAEGSVGDLLGNQSTYRLKVDPIDKAQQILAERWNVTLDQELRIAVTEQEIPSIVRTLVAAEVDVFSIQPHQPTLEDLFLKMTGGT